MVSASGFKAQPVMTALLQSKANSSNLTYMGGWNKWAGWIEARKAENGPFVRLISLFAW